MMSQTQGSIANFFPTIVKTLGYSSNITLLLTAPPYIFAAGYYMGMTALSDVSFSPPVPDGALTFSVLNTSTRSSSSTLRSRAPRMSFPWLPRASAGDTRL